MNFVNFGAGDFPCQIPLKVLQTLFFWGALARDPILELQFPTPLPAVVLCLQFSSICVSAV